MAEYASGNIFIRDDQVVTTQLGAVIVGDLHNFDHTTFFWWGWWLASCVLPGGERVSRQFAARNYRRSPDEPVPYEIPEETDPRLRFVFVPPGGAPPEGAVEIVYDPLDWYVLIRADVTHTFVALGLDDRFGPQPGAQGACIYSHRDAQGEVVQKPNGLSSSYG